jgi:hypothetical protein
LHLQPHRAPHRIASTSAWRPNTPRQQFTSTRHRTEGKEVRARERGSVNWDLNSDDDRVVELRLGMALKAPALGWREQHRHELETRTQWFSAELDELTNLTNSNSRKLQILHPPRAPLAIFLFSIGASENGNCQRFFKPLHRLGGTLAIFLLFDRRVEARENAQHPTLGAIPPIPMFRSADRVYGTRRKELRGPLFHTNSFKLGPSHNSLFGIGLLARH